METRSTQRRPASGAIRLGDVGGGAFHQTCSTAPDHEVEQHGRAVTYRSDGACGDTFPYRGSM